MRIRLCWLLALLVLSSAPAFGQTEEIAWYCWYDADGSFKVKCFAPESGDPANATFDALVSSGDLLGATRLVRQSPGSVVGTMMYIPIYVHPMRGMEFVARLARAVMCYRNTACTVTFDPQVPTMPVGAIAP